MDTGSFPVVKRPERGADHPPPSKCRGHERVQLYLYSPSGPSWPVIGRTLPFLYSNVWGAHFIVCPLNRNVWEAHFIMCPLYRKVWWPHFIMCPLNRNIWGAHFIMCPIYRNNLGVLFFHPVFSASTWTTFSHLKDWGNKFIRNVVTNKSLCATETQQNTSLT